jgi:hypothetical protein
MAARAVEVMYTTRAAECKTDEKQHGETTTTTMTQRGITQADATATAASTGETAGVGNDDEAEAATSGAVPLLNKDQTQVFVLAVTLAACLWLMAENATAATAAVVKTEEEEEGETVDGEESMMEKSAKRAKQSEASCMSELIQEEHSIVEEEEIKEECEMELMAGRGGGAGGISPFALTPSATPAQFACHATCTSAEDSAAASPITASPAILASSPISATISAAAAAGIAEYSRRKITVIPTVPHRHITSQYPPPKKKKICKSSSSNAFPLALTHTRAQAREFRAVCQAGFLVRLRVRGRNTQTAQLRLHCLTVFLLHLSRRATQPWHSK